MEYKKIAAIEAVIIIALIVSFPAYTMSTQPQTITISGAGATFPQPLIPVSYTHLTLPTKA